MKGIIVPIGGTVKLQMTTGKPIKTATVNVPDVVGIRTVLGDPSTLLLTGQQAGIAVLDLEDVDGKKEKYDLIVQLDVEYLRAQLRKAVPGANIDPIPTSANTVLLRGVVNRAEDAGLVLQVAESIGGARYINALTVGGVQQVQLDVGLYRVQRSKARSLAFNFLENTPNWIFGSTVGGVIPGNGPLSQVGVPSPILQPTRFGQNLNSFPGAANLFGGVITARGGLIGFLNALKVEGLAKEVAAPRLVTLSGRPASFLDGGEQAVPVPAGLGQVGVQFEEFGVRLNFLPIVLGNGKIHLEVEPELSALVPNTGVTLVAGGQPVSDRVTQRLNTTVEIEDGQTFVLGGLIQHAVIANKTQVPVLGELPFVGPLFSDITYTETDNELVVLVTPHLVDPQDCSQVTKCLPGQETRSPDDFELFLEGILEAPRGSREVFQNGHYTPAYRNGPTADAFPCANGPNGHCPNCLDGVNGHPATLPAPLLGPVPTAAPAPTPTPTAAAPTAAAEPLGPGADPALTPAPEAPKPVGLPPAPTPPAADPD
jgi:pilus assembly protein CpaC